GQAAASVLLRLRSAEAIVKGGQDRDENDRNRQGAARASACFRQELLGEFTVHRRLPQASAANRHRALDKSLRLPARAQAALALARPPPRRAFVSSSARVPDRPCPPPAPALRCLTPPPDPP